MFSRSGCLDVFFYVGAAYFQNVNFIVFSVTLCS